MKNLNVVDFIIDPGAIEPDDELEADQGQSDGVVWENTDGGRTGG